MSARRSDAGQLRVTVRDQAALAWLIDMRAIGEDDLAVLLARLAGSGPVTVGAATQVVRRWRSLGLAEARRIVVGGPRVITPTPAAAELLGLSGRVAPPAWTQITHSLACSRVRLQVEAEGIQEWISDRALRSEAAAAGVGQRTRTRHLPDGVAVLVTDERVAVEVELSPKPVSRVVEILEDLTSSVRYDRVRYIVSPEALPRVEEAARQAKRGKNPVSIEPLPQMAVAVTGA